MDHFFQFVAIIFSVTSLMVFGIVWMGIDYSKKKRGLTKGVSSRELEELRREMAEMRQDVRAIRESLADVTLILHDAVPFALPKEKKP